MSPENSPTIQPTQIAFRNPIHFLSFGFGSGLVPFAPGTFGTLVAIPIFWFMSELALIPYLAIVAVLLLIGIGLCGYTAAKLGVHDHKAIVWDEIVGYLITMIAAPSGLLWIVVGFILFRLFDIVKPWPISWVDKKIHGGLGIMLDDVLAGALACCVIQFGIKAWAS